MTRNAPPMLAWYGDDFTGAAAVMEVLEFSGFPSVLFLEPPTREMTGRFADARCIGIAGDARTRSPDWMDAHLPAIFAALRATGAGIVHYKMCSTLDSSPQIGSIGRAAEIGLGDDPWAPVLVAAPRIGRWQTFGTLFARHSGGIARLDRHPTMSRHPVTPMDEADVRLHLARQTDLPRGLIDIIDLQHDAAAVALARERARGARLILVDLLDQASLIAAGHLIRAEAALRQVFVVGSQGVEDAIVAATVADGHTLPAPRPAGGADRIAVASGSCSPDTAAQIRAAVSQGFAVISVDATKTVDPAAWTAECARLEAAALMALAGGKSPILASAQGPDDPSISATRTARQAAGQSDRDGAEVLGAGLGTVLSRLSARRAAKRFAVAGGDTSGFATRAFGAVALTAQGEIVPAVPLLSAHFKEPAAQTDWIVKGGQMGPEDLFVRMRDGVARYDPGVRSAQPA
ncbi:four-carbon acid sugar kinase family protein [Tabrizicola sp.]|uniref:four-carbon acid sugar kinase family protein n=1 Tax=Tabrizicola sp. TaxID=2005166 RepID=UPI003F2FD7B8